ncbi:MAG TPA: Mrp/NBP35 family ATP-binding protein [Candidatus Kapabacteria bacterium]|nr:Mrp/NBP35 family ATP-binding protein [Candidatus Kapabacteria bacterium]
MSDLKNKITESVNQIIDKDLGKTLGELNSIQEIIVTDNAIQVNIELIQPIQWIYAEIKKQIKRILEDLASAYKHEIFINEKPINLTNRRTLKGVKNLIAVASGKGGVGKSTIAANIAAGLKRQGATVGILDADVYGPSQPTMFDLEGRKLMAVQTQDGKSAAIPIEQYGVKVASMGFIMNKEEAAIVRGPMLAGYFSMLFEQVEWGDLDFLIFDLPPGTGDIQLTLVQKIPLTGAVIVTTPQDIALADVRRSIAMFQKTKVEILGIVENMSYFTPPELPDNKYYIFGEGGGKRIADEFNVNLLGEVPLDLEMREATDSGRPVILNSQETPHNKAIKAVIDNIVRETRLINHKNSAIAIPNISI